MHKKLSNVAVLLATFNGEKFIVDQIESIKNQTEVDIDIFVSDDKSVDNTTNYIKANFENINFLKEKKHGSAGKNFYYLIQNIDFNKYDFIAFSDQDDIWKNNKLINAINLICKTNSHGYSSAFETFSNSTTNTKYYSKNPKQSFIDHYFSSPGPGCTFVLTKYSAKILQKQLKINYKYFKNCWYHDWSIYAFYKEMNFKWIIDDSSYIYYRQHENNEIGVNNGIKSKIKRFKKIYNKWYNSEIESIIRLIHNTTNQYYFKKVKKISRLKKILLIITKSRRNVKGSIFIGLLILAGLIKYKKIFSVEQ